MKSMNNMRNNSLVSQRIRAIKTRNNISYNAHVLVIQLFFIYKSVRFTKTFLSFNYSLNYNKTTACYMRVKTNFPLIYAYLMLQLFQKNEIQYLFL